jgi:tagatose-1,6-bisphosphate aldolase
MTNCSIGKLRGLQKCTSHKGTFTALAIDHRQNLRRALNPMNPTFVSDADLSRFKLEVAAALADLATAVLLDPEFSAAQGVAAGVLPKQTGLVVAIEATGYSGEETARQAHILPGWSIAKAKRMGADMVKLLVYYHPGSPAAAEVESFVHQIADECGEHDLALILEPLSYSLDVSRKLTSREKRYVVSETARRLVVPGVDVLKAEFPLDIATDQDEAVWAEACAEISAACATPWILLSAAAEVETYVRQSAIACRSGASGIAVGRAVWQEAVGMDGKERLDFLRTTARTRLERLAALCDDLAKPVGNFYQSKTPFDWFKTYPG